jgi:hypothetical protein
MFIMVKHLLEHNRRGTLLFAMDDLNYSNRYTVGTSISTTHGIPTYNLPLGKAYFSRTRMFVEPPNQAPTQPPNTHTQRRVCVVHPALNYQLHVYLTYPLP